MAWTRAVWCEKNNHGVEEVLEQTVPTNWIVSRKLHWPIHLNVK